MPEESTWRGRWPDVASLLLLSLAIAIPVWTLWRPGVINDSDMFLAVYRVFELDQSWHEGVFYPRIAAGLNFGYGGPLFQYYPPLASYLALPFHWIGLGWIEATKAVFTLALFMAGLGAYVYARWLFSEPRSALVVAVAYGMAPYLVLNALERGALAELVALALLPWLFWAMHSLLRTPSLGRMWVAAILVALSVLAHNLTALFVIPFLTIYIILLAWREGAWRRLPLAALALALGLGLSAFYWLPAVAERGFARIQEAMLSDGYQPDQNLRPLTDAVQPSLAFDYWAKSHFRLALWQGLALVAGIIAVAFAPRRLRFYLAVAVGAAVVTLLLQLDWSRAFWQAAPLARFIQFPWRLLGLTSFFIALLLGWLLCWHSLAGIRAWVLALALVLSMVYAGVRYLEPKQLPGWWTITSSQISNQDLYGRGEGLALYTDYMPVSLACSLTQPGPQGDRAPPLETQPAIEVISEGANNLSLRVHAPGPFTLRLPRIYFPTWEVRADSQPLPAGPGGACGLVTVSLPAGSYLVVARFVDTPLRRAAMITSVVCLAVLIVASVSTRRSRKVFIATGVLLALLAVLAVFHHGPDDTRHPVASAANLGDEISLLGYHQEQTIVHPGDTLGLRLYWLARKMPAKDYKVFVHLITPDDTAKVAQDDIQPNLGSAPTTRWVPGEIVVDEHHVSIDPGVPPGTYRVVVGAYDPYTVENLAVTGAAEVLPGDRVVLGTVEVKGK